MPVRNKKDNTTIIVLAASLILYCANSALVAAGLTSNFDNSTLLLLRNHGNTSIPIGPVWLLDFMTDFSSLGSVTVVFLITILCAILFILKKEYIPLKIILYSSAGGGIIELTMKVLFSRLRPQIVPHLVSVDSLSYPSGHSALSVIIYFSIIYIVLQYDYKKSIKLFFLFSALFMILLIGFSRVYLGVHYPTDVIGGWLLGLICSSVSIIAAQGADKI